AAVSEHRRASRTNAFSCVRVITIPLSPGGPPAFALVNCSRRREREEGRMQVPAHVEYEKASSVAHALSLLARYGPEARILAGGPSLIPVVKLRGAPPATRIRINGLSGL